MGVKCIGIESVSIDHPLAQPFDDNTIHLNLTHDNCRNTGREGGRNPQTVFKPERFLSPLDSEGSLTRRICKISLLPLCADPFCFATSSVVSFLSMGVVAPISRYKYSPATTTKSPWIICCYTPREHRRYERGKKRKGPCVVYIAHYHEPPTAPCPPLTHAWCIPHVRAPELPLINAGEC